MNSISNVLIRHSFKSKLGFHFKRFIFDERFLRIDKFREEQGRIKEKYFQTKGKLNE